MKKLLINIMLFFLIAIAVGEVVVRLTHTMADIPQRTIDEYGIQKYFPNQDGYWKGGDHKWKINILGWPGDLPKSNDNLIMVIGDSFIENFMNPNECHQSAFLKQNMPNYNFMETGRAGVSLIEALEISKQIDSLQPVQSLIYINDTDFYESIVQIKKMGDITQLDLDTNTIVYGEMKAPGIKKILYSWKLMYYFYNRFPLSDLINKKSKPEENVTESKEENKEHHAEIKALIKFIAEKYNVTDKTLVFHPNSSVSIIDICKIAGFKTILLDSNNDDTWTFDHDHHWTCYGHKKAAEQITEALKSYKSKILENK